VDKITTANYNYPVVSSLYIVATPIGNMEDISLRALRILREVDLIAAEDTRTTRRLLNVYNIRTAMTSYCEDSRHTGLNYLLSFLGGHDVALVSEAGMPGISDPGYEFIVAAIEQGNSVVPVPGASAPIAALVASGLPTDQFIYLGFLPRSYGARRRLLFSIAREKRTIVAFESPHRIGKALQDIEEVLGDRRISICRELTKVHEEVFRGTVSCARAYFSLPRGEFTLVIEGCFELEGQVTEEVESVLRELFRRGISARDAISSVCLLGKVSKKELYQTWLNFKEGE